MSPTALALAASVTPGAMSQSLQTLERRKFVRRHVEPEDRPKLSVKLTSLGHRRTQACRAEANRLEARRESVEGSLRVSSPS
jgi:DNA-binding MarR family transcriptional regulator